MVSSVASKARLTAQEARDQVLEVIKQSPAPAFQGAYTANIIHALPHMSIRQVDAAIAGLLKRELIRDDRNPVEARRYVATQDGE